jgi:hypothetical protein
MIWYSQITLFTSLSFASQKTADMHKFRACGEICQNNRFNNKRRGLEIEKICQQTQPENNNFNL